MLGVVPLFVDAGAFWQGAGLGLAYPGAGFLASGAWWWTVLTIVAFVVSIGGWVGVGGFVFPVGVWLGSAVIAGLTTSEVRSGAAVAVGVAVVLGLLARGVVGLVLHRRRQVKAAALQSRLARLEVRTPSIQPGEVGELSEEDLACARYIFDRALQPIDQFDGFTTIDQFREAAWRYQLVSMNYALASLQVNYAPAFRGYLLDAQANSIQKMLDRRAWHYWRIENLIGNFKVGADPVKRENIMLSGWWSLALGAFEGATGDRRFSRPGALTFVESERRSYVYDYPALANVLIEQFDDKELCFFPCEPNWVFAICNLFGVTGMLTFDNVHGTTLGRDRLDRFIQTLEREYTTADGRFVMISSRRTGLRLASSSAINPASISWLTNMLSPRLAQTYWEIGSHKLRANGPLEDYVVPLVDAVDPGNYQPTNSYFWATLMLSAQEMGDRETYAVARDRMAANGSEVQDGVYTYRGSAYANLTAHTGRFASEGTWHRFAWGDGPAFGASSPHIAEASYPDVLVARAVTDGTALEAVLRPGRGNGRQAVTIGGLVPGRSYHVSSGDRVSLEQVADATGSLIATATLTGRTELRVAPQI